MLAMIPSRSRTSASAGPFLQLRNVPLCKTSTSVTPHENALISGWRHVRLLACIELSKKAFAKLGHYYGLAKLNHFNIIATSKCLHISLPEIFLTINGSDSLPSGIMLILVQVDRRQFLRPRKGGFRAPPSRISRYHTGTGPTSTCV